MSRSVSWSPMPAALQAPSLISRVPPATSGLGPLARHLLKAVGKAVRPPSTCSALHRLVRLLRRLLTSAAPSRHLSTPVATPENQGQVGRPPRVRRVTFVPNTCRIYARTLRVISGFGCVCPLARMRTPHMRFLFVRPALCLQLPSDPASRQRPCCSANGSHHQGPQRTLTSKSSAGYHPGQTVFAHHAPCLAHKQNGRPEAPAS